MNKLPNFTFNLSSQECGLAYKIELNLPVLLPKLQDLCGIDLKPVVIPLLTKLVRFQIKDLEKCLENKRVLDWSTEEEELKLKNLQEQEKNLVSCWKDLTI